MSETLFPLKPNDHECEKASNGYLMSLVAIMIGLPIPIINVIATGIYYLSNRRESYFVRWHSLQVFLSQLLLMVMNSCGYYWTLSILFGSNELTNRYIAYIITILTFNLLEIVVTIYSAINVRKGKHVDWWLFGPLTTVFCAK